MYAVFKDGKQATKAHSTKDAVMVEAFGAKLAYYVYPDFPRDKCGLLLEVNYKIKVV